jgi:hypothetical protein
LVNLHYRHSFDAVAPGDDHDDDDEDDSHGVHLHDSNGQDVSSGGGQQLREPSPDAPAALQAVGWNVSQVAWLHRRLMASEAAWKVAACHRPPFSSGMHGGTPRMQWPFQVRREVLYSAT